MSIQRTGLEELYHSSKKHHNTYGRHKCKTAYVDIIEIAKKLNIPCPHKTDDEEYIRFEEE